MDILYRHVRSEPQAEEIYATGKKFLRAHRVLTLISQRRKVVAYPNQIPTCLIVMQVPSPILELHPETSCFLAAYQQVQPLFIYGSEHGDGS